MNYKYQISSYKIGYQEPLRGKLVCKEGFLLQCKSSDHLVGYSDYSHLNKEALKKSVLALQSLNTKKSSTVGEVCKPSLNSIQAMRSVKYAFQDMQYQKKKTALFSESFCVSNHYLIGDIGSFPFSNLNALWLQGYRSLKVKIIEDMNALEDFFLNLTKNTKHQFLLRLDFNANVNIKFVHTFLSKLSNILKNSSLQVEFLEDPLPYNYTDWVQLLDKYHYPLAIDLEWNTFCLQENAYEDGGKNLNFKADKALAFSVIVLKPAVQNVEQIVETYHTKNIKFVITHYMDHGVGRLFALLSLNTLIDKYSSQIFLDSGLNTFPTTGDGVFWKKYFSNNSSVLKIKKPIYCVSNIFNPSVLKWSDL
ncbi:MAG: hypothetical protein HAW63_04510 [Bdellovibrionaceae bacterium]|nr:hypothetical protein [Pseudobdellovibrionaceae bacterium]